MRGFFTRAEQKLGGRLGRKPRESKVALEYWHKVGVDGVRDMNPDALTPDMAPTGSKRPDLYILGEAPGAEEDERGIQFIGKSGQLLRSALPVDGIKVRWNNVCRTRPPKNRTPNTQEVECFRPSLIADIERSKPKTILGVGLIPLSWASVMEKPQITAARGRHFPVRIGSHACWFFPVLHPAYLLRKNDRALEQCFRADIARAVEYEGAGPVIEDPKRVPDGIELIKDRKGIREVARFLEREELVSVDIETYPLRPYGESPKIYSIALSGRERTLALPLDHPEANWAPGAAEEVWGLIREWLLSTKRKIAHNAAFELEWLGKRLGIKDLRLRFECTMAQAFVLDERPGGLSLDFLCRLYYGLPLKSLTKVQRRKNMADEDLDALLLYNGADAKYSRWLYLDQRRLIKDRGLERAYEEHRRRIPAIVNTQMQGLAIDLKAVKSLGTKMREQIEAAQREIQANKWVRKYSRRLGVFNPESPEQVMRLLGMMGLEVESTRKDILEELRAKHPLIDCILALREVNKLLGYINALDPNDRDSVVWPDGRIHTSLKALATVTGRLASEDPNVQNFPKRKHAEVRQVVVASKGRRLLAVDYGQIEARVIGMASKDKYLVNALWRGYDIHMEWAEKLAREQPHTLEGHGGDIKKLRTAVKNELTFPLFYGASPRKVANLLGVSEQYGERLAKQFWGTFPGVRKWQQGLIDSYNELGYVESLTGRRRRAPLSLNQIINTPIQGGASDIVVDAMCRLYALSIEKDMPWLAPVLNVHDDLTFDIPKPRLDESAQIIVDAMLSVPYSWVNCPIQVEVAEGPNWYEMAEIGKYQSHEAN